MIDKTKFEKPVLYYTGLKNFDEYNYSDDLKGNFICTPGDHIFYRYEVIDSIGKGSFGTVVKVFDHKHEHTMAIKLIKSDKRYTKMGIDECNTLLNINDWYNKDKLNYDSDFIPLILYKYFKFRNHICMVFDFFPKNLYLYSCKNDFKYNEIVKISKDIFKALDFLRNHKLIHGDLKPENIMVTKDFRGIIIDYGLALFEKDATNIMYIQSRYYRAPEVYFDLDKTCAIDIWSMGCIIYEMYYNKPLFRGRNESEMIVSYISCLGMPFSGYINTVYNKTKHRIDLYNYQYLNIPKNKYIYNNKLIDDDKNKLVHSLILKCLTYNLNMRILPKDALKAEFFN